MNIKPIIGDITEFQGDVIVNSANKSLMRGGGLCGQIHKKAGIELEKECLEIKQKLNIDWIPIGNVIVTKGYNLFSNYIFHTVSPKNSFDDMTLLKKCYSNCIKKADEMNLTSIAFPPIGTGIYNIPTEVSSRMLKEAIEEIQDINKLKEIYLYFLTEDKMNTYKTIFT